MKGGKQKRYMKVAIDCAWLGGILSSVVASIVVAFLT